MSSRALRLLVAIFSRAARNATSWRDLIRLGAWGDVAGCDWLRLPGVSKAMKSISPLSTLLDGDGWLVLRRELEAHVEALDEGLLNMSRSLGTPRKQSAAGDLVKTIADAPGPSSMLPFHTDAGDLLIIACVRAGSSGGELELVNTSVLHDRLARWPRVLQLMHQPAWEFERKGRPGPQYFRYPLFHCQGGRRQCFLQMGSLQRRYAGANSWQTVALQVIDRALDGLPRSRVRLEPGDVLLINNRRVAHRRAPFDCDPAAPRVMLRTWVDLYDSPYVDWRDGGRIDCLHPLPEGEQHGALHCRPAARSAT